MRILIPISTGNAGRDIAPQERDFDFPILPLVGSL
jgi:hypothetical protein